MTNIMFLLFFFFFVLLLGLFLRQSSEAIGTFLVGLPSGHLVPSLKFLDILTLVFSLGLVI